MTKAIFMVSMFTLLGAVYVGTAAYAFELGKQSVPPPAPFNPTDFIKSNKEQVNNICYVWWFKTPPKDKAIR